MFVFKRFFPLSKEYEKGRIKLISDLSEIELLGGVLSQTTWMDIHGPSELGNEYFQALSKLF